MKKKILLFVLIAALLVLPGVIPGFAQDLTYTLTITAGDGQSVWAGTHYPSQLQVTVTDASAVPVPGVNVTFTAPDSGASAFLTSPGSGYGNTLAMITDANGVASVNATANCAPGTVQVTASVDLSSVTFNLTNTGASSAYCRESYWMEDPLNPGQPEPDIATTPIDSPVEGWWWRETSNQNALLQHSMDLGRDMVSTVYTSATINVYEYISPRGSNVTILTSGSYYFIIGCGGGAEEATYAKSRVSYYIYGKTLKGVVITSVSEEDLWGSKIWTKGSLDIPMYGSSGFDDSIQRLFRVGDEQTQRDQEYLGTFLPWSADGFLGSGIMKEYRATLPQFWHYPTAFISESTDITFNGNTIRLIPTGASTDGLMVYIPAAGVLDMGEFLGWHLADAGMLPNPGFSIESLIDAVNYAKGLAPNTLLLKSGSPVTGTAPVQDFLQVQYDALKYIRDQTLRKANYHYTLDETIEAIALPPSLASSPYLTEFASDIPSIVRTVWNEYLGWWGGNTTGLANTLTEDTKAQVLAEAYGSVDALIAAARQAELDARDLVSVEKALYLADAAYRVASDNFEAKQVYAQVLRKNAFMQISAYKRNYYISVANSLGTEQVISDIYKTGLEDTALTFNSEEFSQSFSGISGALLATVKIVSLPEHGVLALSGVDVIAGQEIPVDLVGGLVFTPALDWNGSTSFLWNGKDGIGYAAIDASVRMTIEPLNDAPLVSATPLADVVVDEDASPGAIDLSTGFTDVDMATNGDMLIYAATSSNPEAVNVSVDGANLTLTFQANWNGSATISVTATDFGGLAAADNFTVTVNPMNGAPTAADASITVIAGKSQTINLEYGDLETAQANLLVTFGSLNGTLDTSALPSLTYTAPATAGDDSFTFTVTDRGDPDGCSEAPCSAPLSATATVHVTILPAPSGSISGVVFDDADADSSLDDGESGLAGLVVQLQDANGAQLETFTTGADGAYTFTALEAGSYLVYAPKDANRVQTTDNPNAVTLATSDEVKTGVNIGSVVSADLKVSMTYSVNSKKIIFNITVTNDGPADALNATLTDILPDSIAYVSVISSQGTCSGGKTINCSFGTIATGGSVTVTIQVNRVNTKVAVLNTATVASSIFDIDLADNSTTVTIP